MTAHRVASTVISSARDQYHGRHRRRSLLGRWTHEAAPSRGGEDQPTGPLPQLSATDSAES
jgi:hypothetical protein